MWDGIKKGAVAVMGGALSVWNWFDGKKTKIGGMFFAGSWLLGEMGVPEYTAARQIFDKGSELFILFGIGHAALKTDKGKQLASGLSDRMKQK
jgi:hypothetical protein